MQSLNFKSVTFFYPSRIIGGAEFLFFRLASYLINEHKIKVTYIDYSDGVVREMFQNKNIEIEFIEYTGFNKMKINSETILITPLSSILDVTMYLTGNFKMFLWSIHPSGLLDTMKGNGKYSPNSISFAKIGVDLDFLMSKKGVYFMDETNWVYQKNIFHFNKIPDFFVPIFCDKRNEERKEVNRDETHLGWVGRLSNDKIYSLINIIDHSVGYAAENPSHHLIIHIIGEGSEKKKIQEIKLPENVQIVFLGTLLGDDLTRYANKHFDLVFAMGTSALEMATMKKPVILVDFQYTALPKYNKFRWLYEAENYNVVDKFDEELVRNTSFENLVDLVANKSHYAEGERCFRYYESNHSIDAVGHIIVNGLNQSTLLFNDLKNTAFKIPLIIQYLRLVKRYLKSHL